MASKPKPATPPGSGGSYVVDKTGKPKRAASTKAAPVGFRRGSKSKPDDAGNAEQAEPGSNASKGADK